MYLNEEVAAFVKLNTEDRADQNPVMFGAHTNRFVIADLNPIFEERRLAEEAKQASDGLDYTRFSIASEEGGRIKSLPGFEKRYTVPTSKNRTTDQFVKKIGDQLVQDATTELANIFRS